MLKRNQSLKKTYQIDKVIKKGATHKSPLFIAKYILIASNKTENEAVINKEPKDRIGNCSDSDKGVVRKELNDLLQSQSDKWLSPKKLIVKVNVAMVVSKKVNRSAVKRNRIKRIFKSNLHKQFKDFVWINQDITEQGVQKVFLSLVIFPHPKTVDMKEVDLKKEISILLQKIKNN